MAKSKNVDLTGVLGQSEGPEVDLTDVDLSKPAPAGALDALKAKAAPKPTRTRTPRSRTSRAATIAQSLDTEKLGEAYEDTSARLARQGSSQPAPDMRPMTNLRGEVVEGLSPEEREQKDENPTNVPRNHGGQGFYRNQIHGDYSHFAKLTNLADFLSRKTEETQDALGNHPAAAQFDDIHRMLSVAFGHIVDAQNAHLKGETGLSRVNPQTGRAELIGRQFVRSGTEDPFGRKFKNRGSEDPYSSQAVTRGIGFNPVSKVNAEIGEPQLRSEGISTNLAEDTPFGAVPHFHRAAQLIATASNLLQGSIASVSSDQTIGAKVKTWNGRYDWRAGDPDVITHAEKLSNDYANSVVKDGSKIVEEHDDAAEISPSQVQELFDRTKKAREAEMQAKEQQANIHAGLVKTAYEKHFGKIIAARQSAAERKTAELRTLPVVAAPARQSIFPESDAPPNKNPLEWAVEKRETATDIDYARETSKKAVQSAKSAVSSVPTLLGHATNAFKAGKLTESELSSINDLANEAQGHLDNALATSSAEEPKIAEPEYAYNKEEDPRYPGDIQSTVAGSPRYSRMTPQEREKERREFAASKGLSYPAWQKKVKEYNENLDVMVAQDAATKASHIVSQNNAIKEHHSTITTHADNAFNAVSEIHKKLRDAGVITSIQAPAVEADLTGIPSFGTFARASRPGRVATRSEALSLMKQENEKAQAEAARKAQEEAEKQAQINADRESRRNSARAKAEEFGFLTEDEETARQFLAAGEGLPQNEAGRRRGEFLSALAAKGAVEYTAAPTTPRPGKALFIAPSQPPLTEVRESVSPKRAKRMARAAQRQVDKAAASGRRKLAGNVEGLGLGLNLEDALRVDIPKKVVKGKSEADIEREENEAIIEGLKRAESSPSNIDLARQNLAGITAANAEFDAAQQVGTTIKPTRRTRK